LRALKEKRALYITLTASSSPTARDKVNVQYRGNEAGYPYLLGLREGVDELVIVYPPPGTTPSKKAQGRLDVPSPEDVRVDGYHLILARTQHDLSSFNWSGRDGLWVRAFDQPALRTTPAWGPARCPPDAIPCDSAYGMTVVPAATQKPEAKSQEPKPEPSECERLLVRYSSGDTSAELKRRIAELKCQ
jgi:hypothetical protein